LAAVSGLYTTTAVASEPVGSGASPKSKDPHDIPALLRAHAIDLAVQFGAQVIHAHPLHLIAHQFRQIDFKHACHSHQDFQRRVADAALDLAEVLGVDVRLFTESILRQTACFPESPDVFTKVLHRVRHAAIVAVWTGSENML
jgi:hypothetical protein